MDALKAALESVAEKLKGDLDKRQAELDELSPHFENEADALAYAKRLMALRPGDEALTPELENKSHRNGVFTCSYPYFVLEKTQKPAHEFKPYDPVLVRDENDQRWWPDIFLYRSEICPKMYSCAKSDWKQCIPYKGNEHLSGTRREPEE